jgi:hypothetical protein
MRRVLGIGLVAVVCVVTVGTGLAPAGGEETPSAKKTRERLKQKISVDEKELGFSAMLDVIKSEMDKPFSYKIDYNSGISNNSKVTYKCKDKPVEEVLNELADKYEFGWYVVSNPKDRNDGFIMIRKSKDKERGYEAGKEPKKTSQAPRRNSGEMDLGREEFFAAAWFAVQRREEGLRLPAGSEE